MEQPLYADILFAVNFSMDFLALYITGFILRLRFYLGRAVCAATLGAGYGILSVYLGISGLVSVISAIAVSGIMCIVLFGFCGYLLFLKQTFVFFVANMLTGGGMTAIYTWFNSTGVAKELLIFGEFEKVEEQLPLTVFAIGAGIMGAIALIFSRIFTKKATQTRVSVSVKHEGKRLETVGFEDSGNLLTEPFSGLPVVVLGKADAMQALPRGLFLLLTELRADEEYSREKIRFLVCETVSGKKTMAVFKPDSLKINGVSVSAWVAVSERESLNGMGGNGAAVPSALINKAFGKGKRKWG